MIYSIVIIILLLTLLGAAYHFSNEVLLIKIIPYEQTRANEEATDYFHGSDFDNLPKEEIYIPSLYGYSLHGFYIPMTDANKTVIIVHGVTVSLWHSVKYIDLFQRRGFNVLIYDQPRHGLSGGSFTTFGLREKQDLRTIVDWVEERHGANSIIGVHGESMGAATALLHSAIDHRVAFYIADCPYSTVWDQLAYRLKVEYHLPAFPLLHLTNLICRLRSGFDINQVSPLRDIASVETPILFIHGDADDYVPTQMTLDMYEAKPGKKQLYLAPGANHAEALTSNPAKYDQEIEAFLLDLNLIESS